MYNRLSIITTSTHSLIGLVVGSPFIRSWVYGLVGWVGGWEVFAGCLQPVPTHCTLSLCWRGREGGEEGKLAQVGVVKVSQWGCLGKGGED